MFRIMAFFFIKDEEREKRTGEKYKGERIKVKS